MIVQAVKTPKVAPGGSTLLALLDDVLDDVQEGSVVAITSKIVSLCEGRTVPKSSIAKDELIRREANLYAELPENQWGFTFIFTVIDDTMLPNAGVDESNVEGEVYLLWPADTQATANMVRRYLAERFGLRRVGVVITDSTARPLRWGMGGVSIARSGFAAITDYRGQKDLYGRTFQMETRDVAGGLAAAAVLVMGEGAEQTPIAILSDLPFVEFQDRDPTPQELDALKISMKDDLYGPIFTSVPWKPGGRPNE